MHMRVVRHRRSPGVQHGGDADPSAKVLGIGSDGQHRRRSRPEQEIIDHRLVVERDVGDLGWQGEDDVEVADREQIGLSRLEPRARGGALALGAVTVAAAVVGDAPMSAVFACLDMAPKRRGPALLDRRHDLELLETEMPGMGSPIRGTSAAEDIGDLERGLHWLSRAALHPPSGPSTGRAARRRHGSFASTPWYRARSSPACCGQAGPGSRGYRRPARADASRSYGARCAG
eukprot:Opistho-2@38753